MADPTPIQAKVTPGYLFQDDELLTPAILRAIANPSVDVNAVITSAAIQPGAIDTVAKLGDDFIRGSPLATPVHPGDFVLIQHVETGDYEHTTVAELVLKGFPALATYDEFDAQVDSFVILHEGQLYHTAGLFVIGPLFDPLYGRTESILAGLDSVVMASVSPGTGQPLTVRELLGSIGLDAAGFTTGDPMDPALDKVLVWHENGTTPATVVRSMSVAELKQAVATIKTLGPFPLPTYSALSRAENHLLGNVTPRRFNWYMRLKAGQPVTGGYSAGDVIEMATLMVADDLAFTFWANTTQVGVIRQATNQNLKLWNKTTGGEFGISTAGAAGWEIFAIVEK